MVIGSPSVLRELESIQLMTETLREGLFEDVQLIVLLWALENWQSIFLVLNGVQRECYFWLAMCSTHAGCPQTRKQRSCHGTPLTYKYQYLLVIPHWLHFKECDCFLSVLLVHYLSLSSLFIQCQKPLEHH